MADQHDAHAAVTTAAPHGATDDDGGHPGDDHGGDGHDDHGHDGAEALGPFDLPAWGAAGLGIVLGLVVVLAFMQAAG